MAELSARMPRRREALAAWLRTFAIQGSWNYRTLVGAGLAFALLPLLRRIHAGNPVALRASLERHASSFNGHPYLCAMAVGALARLELEDRDPEQMDRFRLALSGPLGALGDRAVWSGWRPFCVLAASVAWLSGLGALTTVVLFLVVYNAGHLLLRGWAYREGWRSGARVGAVLAGSPLNRIGSALPRANMLLLGLAAGLVAIRLPGGTRPDAVGVAMLAVLGAFVWPRVGGLLAPLLLVAGAVLWLL